MPLPTLPPRLAHESRPEKFIARYLRHTKGEFAGEHFQILDWQRFVLRRIFNDLGPDGRRRIKTFYCSIARKNGKTEFAAALALYMLLSDPEPGAEIYSAAASRDQARLVFAAAKRMVEQDPSLDTRVKVYKNVLEFKDRTYRTLSSDANTAHGLNPNCIIADELHAWAGERGRDFYEVLTTAQGARREPITLGITTAGFDKESICFELDSHAQKVASGDIEDPTFASLICRPDEDADWTSIEAWREANPSLGVTIPESYLAEECQRAKNTPAFQNTFIRLHLNRWTEAESRFIGSEAWSECAFPVNPAALRGRPAYAGLDLANTTDLSAFVLVFPPQDEEEPYQVLPFFWVPKESMRERELKDRVQYSRWAREQVLIPTPGNVIDHKFIIEKIKELAEQYDIQEIAFDRWGAISVTNELQECGFNLVQYAQTYSAFNAPTKELLALVLKQKIAHGNHPVLKWNISNTTVSEDASGNIKPNKKKSREKIDGTVALIMALSRALSATDAPTESFYETNDLLVL